MERLISLFAESVAALARELGMELVLERSGDSLMVKVNDTPRPFQVVLSPRKLGHKYYKRNRFFNVFYRSDADTLDERQERLVLGLLEISERLPPDLVLAQEGPPEGGSDTRKGDAAVRPEHEPLRVATIKLTEHCNTRCVFCNERHLIDKHLFPGDLPRVHDLIDQVWDQGYNVLSFDGGEPTTSPLLADCIHHARKRGFDKIGLVTNGVLLADRAYLDRLLDAGLNIIDFSLHAADPDTSRRVYGTNVLPAQLAALENVSRVAPVVGFTLQSVLVRQNQGSLSELLHLGASFHPHEIIVIYCSRFTEAPPVEEPLYVDLSDGRVIACLSELRETTPEIQLILRNFPRCVVPERFAKTMQWYSSRPSNALPSALRRANDPLCEGCLHVEACSFPLAAYRALYGESAASSLVRPTSRPAKSASPRRSRRG